MLAYFAFLEPPKTNLQFCFQISGKGSAQASLNQALEDLLGGDVGK